MTGIILGQVDTKCWKKEKQGNRLRQNARKLIHASQRKSRYDEPIRPGRTTHHKGL